MKQIINGKRYDTETANIVHEWSNSYTPSDFHYCEETLYLTKKGKWFLHGKGNALSKYSQPVGSNSSTGGSKITPISPSEARVWLETHEGLEALEEYFAHEIEEA